MQNWPGRAARSGETSDFRPGIPVDGEKELEEFLGDENRNKKLRTVEAIAIRLEAITTSNKKLYQLVGSC